MKIVYIHANIANIGGVERILTDKMNYLSEKYKHEIYLVTCWQGKHPFAFPLSNKIRHIDLNIKSFLQYQYRYPKRLWVKYKFNKRIKSRLAETIDQICPDIIICPTNFRADIVCNLKSNAPKIIESHCAKSYTGISNGARRNPIVHFFLNRYLSYFYSEIKRKSDAIVTLTKDDKKEWKTLGKTYIIPNFVTQIPIQHSICKNKRAIAVGRLTYQKGFDQLILVWEIVHKNHPDWKLDIYGCGELKNSLQQQIKDAGLEDSVTIYPPTHDIYSKMQESSIFVFSSRYEGFGLVLIEAMVNGIPCVSFNCPYGPSEIIQHGNNGYLVDNGNIQDMADKICLLIENEEVRKEMGQNARQSAMRYAPENIMPMWERLFHIIKP